MKLARVLAWICLVLGCVAIAIAEAPAITGVEDVGITVSDMDRSLEFYTQVQKQWEKELSGADVEHLKGVFGVRLRVARLKLGSEEIELTEYLAPKGRPLSQDSRGYGRCSSTSPSRSETWIGLPVAPRASRAACVQRSQNTAWNPQGGGTQAFYFNDPDGHVLEAVSPAHTQELNVQGR